MNDFSVFKPSCLYSHAENYHRYLDSSAWNDRKNDYWQSGRPQFCWACNKKSWSVKERGFNYHHLTYRNLYAEKPQDLMLLCAFHHQDLEEDWKFVKKRADIDLKTFSFSYVCIRRTENNLSVQPLMSFFEGLID